MTVIVMKQTLLILTFIISTITFGQYTVFSTDSNKISR
jgi:hypothetical protein